MTKNDTLFRCGLLLMTLLFALPQLAKAVETLTGDTTIEAVSGGTPEDGNLTIEGNYVEVGLDTDLAIHTPGLRLQHDPATDKIMWEAYRLQVAFEWWEQLRTGSKKLKMSLTDDNELKLYDPTGFAEKIVLTPSDSGSSILVDGVSVLLNTGNYSPEELFGGVQNSLGVGGFASAGYINSVALGQGAKTAADSQVVVGAYNEESPLQVFQVGGGSDDANRSNAFSVDADGDTRVNGNLYVAKNAKVNGVLYLAAAGDLSMGSFSDGPRYGFDPDVEAYALAIENVVGLENKLKESHLEEIGQLVKFLKDKGYWESTALFLASPHYNYGSGSVVQKIGGLGAGQFVSDGTPIWTEGGLVFNGSNGMRLAAVSMDNSPVYSDKKRTVILYADLSASLTAWPSYYSAIWEHGGSITWTTNRYNPGGTRMMLKYGPSYLHYYVGGWRWHNSTIFAGVAFMTASIDLEASNGYYLKVWINENLDWARIPADSRIPSNFYGGSGDVKVMTSGHSGSVRAFMYSCQLWSEAETSEFRTLLSNLKWE